MSRFVHFYVLAFYVLAIDSKEVCDCSEINVLKGIVQQILWEQKVESTKLAELETWRMSNLESPRTVKKDFVNHLETMEKKVADIDMKLEKLLKQEDNDKRGSIDVLVRKAFTSEKQERLDFVSDVTRQMADMKTTMDNFTIEINETVYDSIKDLDTAVDALKNRMSENVMEMKNKTESFVDIVVTNVSQELDKNKKHLTDMNTAIFEAKHDINAIERMVVNERVDGKWSNWGAWSTCSVSCGGGIWHRVRKCTNPSPSVLGMQCEGSSRQTENCGVKQCKSQQVAFHASGIKAAATSPFHATFSYVIANTGNDYDKATGNFTCEIPGIYSFSVTVIVKNSETSRQKYCVFYVSIQKENKLMFTAVRYNYPFTGVYHLSKGDIAYLTCDKFGIFYRDTSTAFSGFLVAADV